MCVYVCVCVCVCVLLLALTQERDGALKKVTEYKSKLAEMKQSGRKDISALQTKLAKVRGVYMY